MTRLNEVSAQYRGTHDALERYHELDSRHHLARAYATMKARGTYDPAKHGAGDTEPLTAAEQLERIALSEHLARSFRSCWYDYDAALDAGATWAEVSSALGEDEAMVRLKYREQADRQHELWQHYDGKFGLSAEEHTAAISRANVDQPELEA